MALDHALLDRVVVGPVVDQVPRAVGDVPRVVRRGALPQPVDELKLEALDLSAGSPGAIRGSGSAIVSFHIEVATSKRLRRVMGSIAAMRRVA